MQSFHSGFNALNVSSVTCPKSNYKRAGKCSLAMNPGRIWNLLNTELLINKYLLPVSQRLDNPFNSKSASLAIWPGTLSQRKGIFDVKSPNSFSLQQPGLQDCLLL